MKRLIFIISYMLFIILCSCNDAEYLGNEYVKSDYILRATIEQKNQARSVIDFNGNVSWTDNDYIGVCGKINRNVKFHYSSNENDKENFIGNFDSENDQIEVAYYPYNIDAQYDGNSIRFDIQEINEYQSENKAPMIGHPITDKHIIFSQTGGVLVLKIIGMPENASKIQIISDNDSPCLSGSAVISNLCDGDPLFKIENGKHMICYDISSLISKKKMLKLNVPLQVGLYKKLHVKILDDNNHDIKSLSLSDINVTRADMINTKTINCSDILYCTMLPEECLKETQWSEGLTTSTEILILRRENEDKSSITTLHNLRNQDELSIVTDTLGYVTEFIFNDEEYLSVVNRDSNKISYYYYSNNNFEYIEESTTSARHISTANRYDSRAGVDGMIIFQTLDEALSVLDLIKIPSTLEEKVSKVFGDTFDSIKDNLSIYDSWNDEVDLLAGLLDPSPNRLKILIALGAYAEKKLNKATEAFYNKLCGATINVLKPTVEGSKIHFGYSVRNTSKIPKGNGGFDSIQRKCYVSVLKRWNGQKMPGILSFITGEEFGRTEVVANKDFDSKQFSISFEKGFTYYFIARIILTTTYTDDYASRTCFSSTTYSSDIEHISADNIGEIKTNSIKFQNNKVEFDFTIHGEKLNGQSMGVELFHDEKKVWDNFDYAGTGSRCVISLNKNDFDCNYASFKATAKGRWRLRSYVNMPLTLEKCYSEFIDFDKFIYDESPSVRFINPIIQRTEELSSRARADGDDDSKKYITYFSYGLDIKGGFWISHIDAKSDTEGPIWNLSKTNIISDQQEAFDYSWVYSEKRPINPTLWYDITLRNGDVITSENGLKFSGCPMNQISIINAR